MIVTAETALLMIEPKKPATDAVIDDLTRKVTGLWRARRTSDYGFRGFHRCVCGAASDNHDHWIGDLLTNSLAIHYIAHHRDEVPASELEKLACLDAEPQDPTAAELLGRGFENFAFGVTRAQDITPRDIAETMLPPRDL